MIIAIDGVSGAGKTTISKQLADKLGYDFLSTGMIYRAVAFNAVQYGISSQDEERLRDMLVYTNLRLSKTKNGKILMILNGDDVTGDLYVPEVNLHVSEYASVPKIRKFVQNFQYKQAQICPNFVIEGRDIGSVVFPDADLKIFLDCDLKIRAERRCDQMKKNGRRPYFQDVVRNLEKRDIEDKTRSISPLVICEDAVVVDTSNITKDQAVDEIVLALKRVQTKRIVERKPNQECHLKTTPLHIQAQKFDDAPKF